jgi:hypothetical protein
MDGIVTATLLKCAHAPVELVLCSTVTYIVTVEVTFLSRRIGEKKILSCSLLSMASFLLEYILFEIFYFLALFSKLVFSFVALFPGTCKPFISLIVSFCLLIFSRIRFLESNNF